MPDDWYYCQCQLIVFYKIYNKNRRFPSVAILTFSFNNTTKVVKVRVKLGGEKTAIIMIYNAERSRRIKKQSNGKNENEKLVKSKKANFTNDNTRNGYQKRCSLIWIITMNGRDIASSVFFINFRCVNFWWDVRYAEQVQSIARQHRNIESICSDPANTFRRATADAL